MGLVYSPVAPDSLSGLLSATPTATTPAGIYAMIAGTLPAGISALGDLFNWSGSSADSYCAYEDAPDVIDVLGVTYYRAPAPVYWSKITSTGPTIFTSPTVIDVPATYAAPTKPPTPAIDYIAVTDDSSGFCSLQMHLALDSTTGASPGNAPVYLWRIPGGAPDIDLAYHKPVINLAANLQGYVEVGRAIPGSLGNLARSDGIIYSATAYAYDARRFFLVLMNNSQKVQSNWMQLTSAFANLAYSIAFKYKKV